MFQQRHQITALMGKGIAVQTFIIVAHGMIVVMVVNKGKIKPFYVHIFPEHGKIRIVRKHFVYTIDQGIGCRVFRICPNKFFYYPGVAPVGLQ